MTTFFTADTHFGHDGILDFAKRPFISADAMDRALVDIWNGVVRPRDTVWHLGDFAYGRKVTTDRCRRIFAALHGEKHLVQGNHDYQNDDVLGLGWASVQERKVLHCESSTLVLDHYPLRTWYGAHHGSFNLYGHVHGRMKQTDRACDVGVDCWSFMPVRLAAILERMKGSAPHDFGQADR